MPLYAYQVIDKNGIEATGKLEAENEFAAIVRLRKLGYIPIEVTAAKTSPFSQILQLKKKVSLADLALFSRQLAAMLSAGIPLTRCLNALGEQAVNAAFGKILLEVARNVEGGMSFSEALRAYPEVFSQLYVDMIKAGEVGGTLERVLQRLAEQLESEKQLRDNMRAAMFYPTVVLMFAVLVVTGMMIFVVPVFLGFYPEDVELPLITQMVIGFSNSLRAYWYLYCLGLIVVLFAARTYLAQEQGKILLDKIKFRAPVFGSLVQKTVVARFARTLATLLAGGIAILQALETAGPASGNSLIAKAVAEAAEWIQQGQNLARPLQESGLFPPMVTLMISVGEETGDLPGLLNRVADFYEAEVAAMSKGLTSLIEPLMLIGVGGIVAVIVIALYLPMFTVISQFQ